MNQYNHLAYNHFDPAHGHRPDVVDSPLYVVTPVFNPKRYRARWKLYKDFENYVLKNNEARLVTIEVAFGERAECILKPMHDKHIVIHLRTKEELWLKENMINLAIQHLPFDWKYVAWIDGDITFARPDWVGECVQQLQHYQVLQMFDEAFDMDPDYHTLQQYTGFMYCYKNKDKKEIPSPSQQYYTKGKNSVGYWHPGFAWAARREAIDSLGGLIDWAILGGGDTYMSYALIGELNNRTMPKSLVGSSGLRMLEEWQRNALIHIQKNVGYMKGSIFHQWHGSRRSRGYKDRGQILTAAKFDPITDLKRDYQGLYQLTDGKTQLKEDIRDYFGIRNEDSIEVPKNDNIF